MRARTAGLGSWMPCPGLRLRVASLWFLKTHTCSFLPAQALPPSVLGTGSNRAGNPASSASPRLPPRSQVNPLSGPEGGREGPHPRLLACTRTSMTKGSHVLTHPRETARTPPSLAQTSFLRGNFPKPAREVDGEAHAVSPLHIRAPWFISTDLCLFVPPPARTVPEAQRSCAHHGHPGRTHAELSFAEWDQLDRTDAGSLRQLARERSPEVSGVNEQSNMARPHAAAGGHGRR